MSLSEFLEMGEESLARGRVEGVEGNLTRGRVDLSNIEELHRLFLESQDHRYPLALELVGQRVVGCLEISWPKLLLFCFISCVKIGKMRGKCKIFQFQAQKQLFMQIHVCFCFYKLYFGKVLNKH